VPDKINDVDSGESPLSAAIIAEPGAALDRQRNGCFLISFSNSGPAASGPEAAGLLSAPKLPDRFAPTCGRWNQLFHRPKADTTDDKLNVFLRSRH
jgi:hypothetical protein